MLQTIYGTLITGLLICVGLCLFRIGAGPSAADRMVAIDVLGTVLVGFVAVITMLTAQEFMLSVAIVWALVSSVGTLSLAKHLEGKQLDE